MSTFRAIILGLVAAAVVLVVGDAQRGDTATYVTNNGKSSYVIAPGTASTAFTLPATNQTVTLNAAVTAGGTRGVCSGVLCYTNAAPATLAWTGHAPSAATGASAFGGSTTATGTSILPLNVPANVYLRVGSALNKVEIFNDSSTTVNATIEWTY